MFRKIPGNDEFLINSKFEIVRLDGAQGCTPAVIDKRVKIKLYSQEMVVDLEWLYLMARMQVFLPEELQSRLMDVYFEDLYPYKMNTFNKVMVFRRPMVYKEIYRIVPNYTNYAVSKEGEVVRISTGNAYSSTNKEGEYPVVTIYDPIIGNTRSVLIHRLVALAWVKNDDRYMKSVVNHIDGVKTNYHYRNLEWCTFQYNSIHAVNAGLREDNVHVKVFDITDKSVKDFYSIKQACRHMGIPDDRKIRDLTHRTQHKLINDRYQIKLATDTSEWFYMTHAKDTPAGRYTIYIEKPDGVIETHPDVRKFKKDFSVWNVSSINDLLAKAREKYPDWKFSIKDNYIVKPVQAYEVGTGKIIEAEGINQMVRVLGFSKNSYVHIRTYIGLGETRIYKGYAFRYKTDTPWNTEFEGYQSRPKCILATKVGTEEFLEFNSERAAARHFKVRRSAIKGCVKLGKLLNGYFLHYNER